jgi:predicted DNA-binding transcriptional regulator AlpA
MKGKQRRNGTGSFKPSAVHGPSPSAVNGQLDHEDPDRILSCTESAHLLGISEKSVRRLGRRRDLATVHMCGRRVGYRRRDLLAYIEAHCRPAAH